MRKQGSTPSLPSVRTNFADCDCPSSPSSQSSTTSPPSGRALRSLPSSPKPLRALTRSKTGGDIGSVAGSEEDPGSPSVSLPARKRMFLRKRSTLKWIYSEELRNSIFDDMLDEDVSSRPTPAQFLAGERLQSLLASCDTRRWGPAGETLRPREVNDQTNSTLFGEDAVEENIAPTTVAARPEAPIFHGFSPQRAQKLLLQMTP